MLAGHCPCCGAPCWYVPEQVGSIATCRRCFTEFTLPRKALRGLVVLAGFFLSLLVLLAGLVLAVLGVQTTWVPLPSTVPPGDNSAAVRLLGGMDWRIAVGAIWFLVVVFLGVVVASKAGLPQRMMVLVLAAFACLGAVFCFAL